MRSRAFFFYICTNCQFFAINRISYEFMAHFLEKKIFLHSQGKGVILVLFAKLFEKDFRWFWNKISWFYWNQQNRMDWYLNIIMKCLSALELSEKANFHPLQMKTLKKSPHMKTCAGKIKLSENGLFYHFINAIRVLKENLCQHSS